ncbi:MAG: GIY-YIG nuclease family protein [Selenomonadaceae bacterium]|nr:GIY-YIG nuclease family protein [Selenomonadaceae bacterium]
MNNQKAVYLITDTNTGKLYVGSATAQYGMLLQRWSEYISNGHGGNIELKNLVDAKGFDYVKKHFQYSVLENYNARMDDKYILNRESWWKETLCSRTHGYNAN